MDANTAKLVVIIVSDQDGDRLMRSLIRHGYPATKIGSTGGFLRRGNATILSGVDEEEVDSVLALVRSECRARTEYLPVHSIPFGPDTVLAADPVPVRVGGATIFVMPVERFERT